MMVRTMTADHATEAAARRIRVEWLTFAGVFALLVLCAVVFQAEARVHALRQQSDQLRVQARVVGENVLLQVNGVDKALSGVQHDFSGGRPDPEGLKSAQQRFRTLAAALPGVRAILVLDAKGTVLAATRDELLGMKFSGRDYFVRPRNRPDRDVLYVSRPFETSEGEWVMPVSQALLDDRGAFAGVVVAGLDSRYLAVVLRSVVYAPDMSATLAHGDGNLFLHVYGTLPDARRPGQGESLLDSGRATLASDEPEVRHSGNSGEGRLVVSRIVEETSPRISPPMIVEVTRSVDAILLDWRHDTAVLAGTFVLSMLLSAVGLRMLQQRRIEIAALAATALLSREQAARRIRTITDSLPALVAHIDREHRYRFANARYRTFYDLDPEELVGRFMADVIGRDVHASFSARLDAVLRGEPQHFQQHGVAGKEDVYFNIDFIPDVEVDGTIAGFFVMAMDITALKHAEQKLAALAHFDTLTGLANRHQFTERFASLLRAPADPSAPIALMFLDIDRFKSINDSLGHAAGDEVLKEFARRLAAVARPTDCVARLAGDEFVIMLEGIRDRHAIGAIAEKILATVAVDFLIAGRLLSISTSIGIARAAVGETSLSALLAAADAALYEAKARGRATFVVSDSVSDSA
jgi:diguanylate cyclase (GGDEF)-like protein/PAS domain S-box-containing protein